MNLTRKFSVIALLGLLIHFTPSTNGWPQGKYKFEALMLNEEGEKKDSKSQDFTVN